MRRILDRLYVGAGWLSAGFILAIATLVSAQVLLNFGTRVLGLPLPSTIPSYADFAGFMLAAATFFALPYTFRTAGHIRVSLVTRMMPPRLRWGFELLALAVAAGLTGYACYYAGKLIEESHRFGDVSNGIIPIPLWIPQIAMAAGLALLLLSILDTLQETFRKGEPVIEQGDGEEV